MQFKFPVTGMGAALVDVFADVSETELAALGSPKASMSLIDNNRARDIAGQVTIHARRPGGSAANTIAGIANIGLTPAFIGKIGDDELGELFRAEMRASGVTFEPAPLDPTDNPTGHCIVLVTPDAERTMHTLLGASVTTAPADLDPETLGATGLFFAEGYVWDSPSAQDAFRSAADMVHAGGGRVGLSLSDSFCVARHKRDFIDLVHDTLDFVMANSDEATALFDTSERAAQINAAREFGKDMVITHGSEGATLIWGGDVTSVDAVAPQRLTDLTGAGDQFAAGFLAGIALGRTAAEAGRMGAIAAAEVIEHFGPRPEQPLSPLFRAAGIEVAGG